MKPSQARARFASGRTAHLATADADGLPHVVVVCFALEGEQIYTAVDAKPKTTPRLRRLENLRANPRVSILVDHYDDRDWSRLWWVRGDGAGRVLAPGAEWNRAVRLLMERYQQYRETPPPGPVIALRIQRWSGWSAS